MVSTRSRNRAAIVVAVCVLVLVLGARCVDMPNAPVSQDADLFDGGNATDTERVDDAGRIGSAGQREGGHEKNSAESVLEPVSSLGLTYGDAVSGEGTLVSGDLPTVAQGLVLDYRSQGNCLLRHAGYLDLLGNVWGCVVQGPKWVDVCVVSQGNGESESVVRIERLEAGS